MSIGNLNPLATRVCESLLAEYPSWAEFADALQAGELELAVPAPQGSRAGHLVIFTARGEDTWIRFAPPRACYAVESDKEMLSVIEALLHDQAFFAVVTRGDDWLHTSLLRPGEEPVLQRGDVANVVSWSGQHDRIVTPGPATSTTGERGA